MAKGSLRNKQNRMDRLIGLLRTDHAWTSLLLCHRLQVSHRTLMRDLSELRELGYPIESSKGRGGGIRLNGRWGVGRLHLTDQEVVSMLVSLAIAESLQSPLLLSTLSSIRQKITLSFPERQRHVVNKLRSRIFIGDHASERVLASFGDADQAVINAVNLSFFRQTRIRITYCDESHNVTNRDVEVQYLLLNWPVWYLLGWDDLRQAVRLFRIDRITSAQPLKAVFELRRKSDVLKGFESYFLAL
ncbi:MAG: helix-turn-helix transcriptional regulator [Arenicella sp.]